MAYIVRQKPNKTGNLLILDIDYSGPETLMIIDYESFDILHNDDKEYKLYLKIKSINKIQLNLIAKVDRISLYGPISFAL